MCNLYSITKNQAAIRDLFQVHHDHTGNPASFLTLQFLRSGYGHF
jgi:hypothetical protein